MRRRLLTFIVIAAVLAGGVRLSIGLYERYQEHREKRLLLKERKAAWQPLTKKLETLVDNFNGTVAFVIEDLATGLELVANEDKSIPSASMVKIPIMAACFYAVSDGRLRLDETMRLERSDKTSGSGVLKDEKPGTTYTIEELIILMVSQSDNTAANMLTNRLGMQYLNESFKRMGLKDTNISRVMMDFDSRSAGIENYTTARDMALLLEKMYEGRLIDPAVSKRCLTILAMQKVNDRIPKRLPAGTVISHKTGLENMICHDAGIVYTAKGNFLICVLTKHRYKSARPSKKVIADIARTVYDSYT